MKNIQFIKITIFFNWSKF